jgi:hypothetical protein
LVALGHGCEDQSVREDLGVVGCALEVEVGDFAVVVRAYPTTKGGRSIEGLVRSRSRVRHLPAIVTETKLVDEVLGLSSTSGQQQGR